MSKPNSVVEHLSTVLANSYFLAVKTHGAHWNVTGVAFFQFHNLFSEQYTALFTAADDIAERIRALGAPAPGDMTVLAAAASLPAAGKDYAGVALAKILLADHRTLAALCRAGIAAAQKAADEVSADLFITRCEAHEKTAWMLAATIA